MMFLLTCDKKLTKSQLSPTHASTKRKITDELKHNAGWSLLKKYHGTFYYGNTMVFTAMVTCSTPTYYGTHVYHGKYLDRGEIY